MEAWFSPAELHHILLRLFTLISRKGTPERFSAVFTECEPSVLKNVENEQNVSHQETKTCDFEKTSLDQALTVTRGVEWETKIHYSTPKNRNQYFKLE